MQVPRWANHYDFDDDIVHEVNIMPIADLKEHEFGAECWCRPMVEYDVVFIHNSLDGRERFEDLAIQ